MRKSAAVAVSLLIALALPALSAAQSPKPAKPPAAAGAQTKKDGAASTKKDDVVGDTGFNLNTGNDKDPMQIEADQGLEWRQNDKIYIARGNVKVTRGKGTVFADTMIAHYRPSTKPSEKKAPAANGKTDGDPTEGTEIYNVEADGNVKMVTETDTIYAERVVYDLDAETMVATGKNLKLVTPQETVTARDSFEWYDKDQVAVARGNAVATRDNKVLRADVLVASVTHDQKGGDQLSRLDAQGNVMVTSEDQIGHGDSAVYNADTGIVTLIGHVRLTRGTDELRGEYAVVDTKKNVSRLLPTPPGGTIAGRPGRVSGWLVPPETAQKPQSAQKPESTPKQ
jgi:lipopolysaccharide export system protein LptA